jgi:hypothetical protein
MDSSLIEKLCTTCLQSLPLGRFYSKGNRSDSSCKECQKERKRTTYVAKKSEYNTDHLKRVFDLLLDFELQRTNRTNQRVQEVIDRCLKK